MEETGTASLEQTMSTSHGSEVKFSILLHLGGAPVNQNRLCHGSIDDVPHHEARRPNPHSHCLSIKG
jgi:creatinine amidohydrolase/Fe(II)-dependent formamide hydrolase-like protein